jgi:hypothetical protein
MDGKAIRWLDETARLWNDICIRLPRRWFVSVAALGCIVLTALAGIGLSGAANEPAASTGHTSVAQPPACHAQTWPFFSEACLRRNSSLPTQGAVRVISANDAEAAPRTTTGGMAPKPGR